MNPTPKPDRLSSDERTSIAPAAPSAPTFLDVLATAEDGRLAQHLTMRLSELAQALRAIVDRQGGKPKGKLLLALELKLDGGLFEMVGAVQIRKPEPARQRSILYDTPNGLSVDNPRQMSLPFAKDAAPAGDLRVV